MRETSIPEMRRSPLENLVLKAKMLEMGPPAAILGLALDPPDKQDIMTAILILKEVGALLRLNNGRFEYEDGEITYIGRIMEALPLDVRVSKFIILGYAFSILDDCIKIGAGLSIKSIFKVEYKKKLEAYSQKLSWADGSGSDCIALLNAFKSWIIRHEQGHFRDKATERGWTDRFHLEIRNLYEMKELVKEIVTRLEKLNIKESSGVDRVIWTDREKPIIIKMCIAGAFFPNFFLRFTQGETFQKTIHATLNGRDPLTTVYFSGMQRSHIGILYENQIKDYFNDMKVCRKDQIKVHFDSNSEKVFVTFSNDKYLIDDSEMNADTLLNNIVPGRVLPEVYKAVKLRKTETNNGFVLKVME